MILDTYLDGQTGFVFGTNPAGIEYDGQVTREGEGSFGSAGGFNLNRDAVWEVRTSISDSGWSAEIAIPFRSLRFPREEIQTWVINLQRNIRRRNLQLTPYALAEGRREGVEDASYFAVGVPEEVELFFSRRIGIGPRARSSPLPATSTPFGSAAAGTRRSGASPPTTPRWPTTSTPRWVS